MRIARFLPRRKPPPVTVNVTVNGSAASPQEIARAVQRAVLQYQHRNPGRPV